MRDVLGYMYLFGIALPIMFVGCMIFAFRQLSQIKSNGVSVETAQKRYRDEADDFMNKISVPYDRIMGL